MFGKKNNDHEYRIARLEKACKELSEKCEASGHLIATLQKAMQTKDIQIADLKEALATLERKAGSVRKPQAEKDDRPNISYEFGPKHTIHPNEDYKQ